jgi:catechol 2,3-dioxygenase-like lactoylglutathione lyase family enzyme
MTATLTTVAAPPQRCATPVVKVRDIAYVRLGRRDLDRAERYYTDFGLTVSARTDTALYFRGALGAHHCWIVEHARRDEFLGLGFTAGAREDLDRLARLPGASPVDITGEPGGGERVMLRDPSGTRVDVVFGMADLPELPVRDPNAFNTPRHKARVNRPQPTDQGRELVFRLGHAVMQKQEFHRNAQWYCDTLGLIPSDVLLLPDNHEAVLAFMRCDRGSDPSDHHTVVVAAGMADELEHCAFETLDLDAVARSAQYLRAQGWNRTWGLGRHILGSQIFDYQRDPAGLMVEHFADGDVFDANYPTGFTRWTGPASISGARTCPPSSWTSVPRRRASQRWSAACASAQSSAWAGYWR